jgi:hypothetical protein
MLSKEILGFLDGLSEDYKRVSSRRIKDFMLPTCSSSTWTRSIALASEYSNDWALVGQSFTRRDAAYYGFIDESESELGDHITG